MRANRSFDVDIKEFDITSYESLYHSFRWHAPKSFNIGTAIADVHCTDRGDDVAIYYETETGYKAKWSFRHIRDRSNQLANLLRELGVSTGEIVGVYLPSRPETVVALASIYKLGCIALSISPLFGIDAVRYRLQHSAAKALIMEGERREVREDVSQLDTLTSVIVVDGDGFQAKERSFDEIRECSVNLVYAETTSEEPAQLFYTSGTTGPPKGALHAHRFLLGHLPCFQIYFELAPKEGDVYWTPADWGWIGALGDVVLPALYFGMPVVALRRAGRFEPRIALEIMEKYGVTCAFVPPTALRLMRKTVERPAAEYDLKLRAICSAGESVGAEIVRWGRRKLGVPINEFYGCTECNLVVVTGSFLMETRPGAMGKPCPGHVTEVIDQEGSILPSGVVGQIAVKAPDPVMFLGYWQNPQATQQKFIGDWFLTGDLGYKDTDGYVWFKGRADDVIKSAGYRIGPEEVEHVINLHAAVLESAVVPKFDPLRGNIVKAFVVLKQGAQASERLKQDIQESVKQKLAAYAYPREIEFIAEIPKTVTGKLRRFELRKAD